MTAQDLFDYAATHSWLSEQAGEGTQFPTVRACASHFKAFQQEIEDIISDGVNSGYLGLAVAMRAGNGIVDLELGDQLVEAFR